jgi:hypothetical protein
LEEGKVMSYSIEYNPELKNKYPSSKTKIELPTKKLIILFVVLITSYVFMQCRLYRYCIPGNPDVTVSAFSTMVERVGDGDSVKDAFCGFCREIIQNGNP